MWADSSTLFTECASMNGHQECVRLFDDQFCHVPLNRSCQCDEISDIALYELLAGYRLIQERVDERRG